MHRQTDTTLNFGLLHDVTVLTDGLVCAGATASSWMQCCDLCDAASSSGCKAWTYVPTESMCWLKSSPTGSKERLGLVSGVAPGATLHNDKTGTTRYAEKEEGMLGYIRSLLLGKEEL
eukprot:COSAG02_NODE_244_length_27402_cov_41.050397_20_plen_118_part_00